VNEQVKKVLRGNDSIDFHHHIGGGLYVSVNSDYKRVDIRKFYKPNGQCNVDDNDEKDVKPTRVGVSLKLDEWAHLWSLVDVINGAYPSLAEVQPCYYGNNHLNQMEWLECTECHPFTNSLLAKLMR